MSLLIKAAGGDMNKSEYDSDEDGVIILPQFAFSDDKPVIKDAAAEEDLDVTDKELHLTAAETIHSSTTWTQCPATYTIIKADMDDPARKIKVDIAIDIHKHPSEDSVSGGYSVNSEDTGDVVSLGGSNLTTYETKTASVILNVGDVIRFWQKTTVVAGDPNYAQNKRITHTHNRVMPLTFKEYA